MLSERFQCPRCEKNFGHQQILQLHLRVHGSNGDDQIKSSHKGKEDVKRATQNTGQLTKNSSCMLTNNERLQSSAPSKNSSLLSQNLANNTTQLGCALHYTLVYMKPSVIQHIYIHASCLQTVSFICNSRIHKFMVNETRYAVTPKEGTQPVGTNASFQMHSLWVYLQHQS